MTRFQTCARNLVARFGVYLRDNWVPCPIYPNIRAVERSHPRGVGFWETGGALKGHHFFAVGLSKQAHLEYDANHDGFEARHVVTHAELVKKQWEKLGVSPGAWMFEGMPAEAGCVAKTGPRQIISTRDSVGRGPLISLMLGSPRGTNGHHSPELSFSQNRLVHWSTQVRAM